MYIFLHENCLFFFSILLKVNLVEYIPLMLCNIGYAGVKFYEKSIA